MIKLKRISAKMLRQDESELGGKLSATVLLRITTAATTIKNVVDLP